VLVVTTPGKERSMDPLELLKHDHAEVKQLMEECASTSDGAAAVEQREQLFAKIHAAMTVHEIIEEEIFYPALKEHPKARDIVLEGIEEHGVVDSLMGELATLPVKDETWAPKFKVMKENVEHHIEEEEGEMFPQAKKVFDASDLERRGKRMSDRKEQAMQQERSAAS
jgi:hemerythrin superfamily protein